jgi:hypothetical protein
MTGPTKKELEIILKVKNDASKEMKRVGDEAQAVGAKAKKGAKEATDSFISWEGAAKRVGAAIKGLLNPLALIGGALGVGAIIGLAKGMSEAADQAEAVQGKFDLVFGERAVKYGENIDALAKDIGRSRTELRSMAADMQIVATEMLGSEEAAQAVTDAFVRLSIDVGELRNVADADVMAKFTAAVLGSGRALREFGVSITPAQIEAKALALGLAATTEELTEQDKAVANINLIFEKLEYAQGEAARSSDEFGSRMKDLLGIVQNVREEFGQRLNDAIVQGFDDAGGVERVADLVKVFNGAIAEFARVGVATAAELATAAADALDEFGGANGVIAWLQDRGNALVAQIRVFGAELAVVAVEFANGVERMIEKLRPALEFLGLVRSGNGPTRDELLADRAGLGMMLARSEGTSLPQDSSYNVDLRNRIAAIDMELARMERLAAFDAERVRAREQLAAAQARLNTVAGTPNPWADADFSGLGPALRRGGGGGATGASVANASQAMANLPSGAEFGPFAPQSIQAVTQWTEAVGEATSAAQRFADRQTGQMADAFLGVATGATKAKDAVKQFFQSFIADLLRLQTQKAFSTLFGSLFAGAFGAVNAAPAEQFGPFLPGPTIPGGWHGGHVKGYARGGEIDSRDTVPAMLAPGEYVMQRSAVERYGKGFMSSVNQGRASMSGTQNVSVALTVNALDGRGAVQVLSQDIDAVGDMIVEAIARNRNLSSTIRGRN